MPIDTRQNAAAYYDLDPTAPQDIPFYLAHIPSAEARVLELGCGTGRILTSLIVRCAFVLGIDSSEAMLAICKAKLEGAAIPSNLARVELGDVTRFRLGVLFDLILVPFVFQTLESDEEVAGLLRCIRNHLSATGTCIINTPMPPQEPSVLRREWCADGEQPAWEVHDGTRRVTCHYRKHRLDRDRLVLYPDLVYRCYGAGELVDETVMSTVMRCWYPEEFRDLFARHEFDVVDCWGGYAGEPYGAGPELVVEFKLRTAMRATL